MESTSNGALVSLSGDKPRRKRTLDDKACEVCNDKSTGKHYGVYCCDGCSGFFKRTVRRSIPWVCRNNNQCVVDRTSRTDCRACRFKKCLLVKMNPEGVQNSPSSRSVLYEGTSRENNLTETNYSDYRSPVGTTVQAVDTMEANNPGVASHSMTTSSFSGSCNPPPISMALPGHDGPDYQPTSASPVLIKVETEQCNTYIEVDKNSELVGKNSEFVESSCSGSDNSSRIIGHSSETVDKNSAISATESGSKDARQPVSKNAFVTLSQPTRPVIPTQQPQVVQKQILVGPNTLYTHHSPYQSTGYPLTSPMHRYRLKDPDNPTPGTTEMSSTSISSVHNMVVQLLSNAVQFAKNVPSFKTLPFRDQIILLEESWKDLFLLDAAFLSSPLDVSYIAPAGDGGASLVSNLRVLQDLFTRIQALEVDESECTYLKTIFLFKPDIKGLKDSQQIEKHQDEAQVKLSDYVRTTHSENPARFGRILLTLTAFERVSQEMIEKLFFRSETNQSVEYILHDLFKKT